MRALEALELADGTPVHLRTHLAVVLRRGAPQRTDRRLDVAEGTQERIRVVDAANGRRQPRCDEQRVEDRTVRVGARRCRQPTLPRAVQLAEEGVDGPHPRSLLLDRHRPDAEEELLLEKVQFRLRSHVDSGDDVVLGGNAFGQVGAADLRDLAVVGCRPVVGVLLGHDDAARQDEG